MKTVIEMAREAGFKEHNGMIYATTINDDCAKEIERFAELIRADAIAEEREACAKVCEDIYNDPKENNGYDAYYTRPYLECADDIRARGQRSDEALIRSNT